MNWYTYAANNPLRFVDPTGLAYEDFEKVAQAKTSFDDLASNLSNLFTRDDSIASDLRTRQRDILTQGVGNDPTVASAQAALVMMGFNLGAHGTRHDGVDGIFGKKTETATGEFQQAVGLKATGKIDTQTMAALDLAVRAGLKKKDIEIIGKAFNHYDLVWPTESQRITSPFGMRFHPIKKRNELHKGIDIGAVKKGREGDEIVAAASGRVIVSGYQRRGAGHYLTIESLYAGQRIRTTYMHLQKGSMVVKQGDWVSAGQYIAGMGKTGNVTGVHLHFEIRVFENGDWVPVDSMLQNYRYE